MNIELAVFEGFAHAAGVPVGEIDRSSTVVNLGIPSLDALEMLFDLEEKFDLQIGEHDIDLGSATVNDLVNAIESALARKNTKSMAARV